MGELDEKDVSAQGQSRLYMRWATFNLALAMVGLAVILWIHKGETGMRRRMADVLEQRQGECGTRVIHTPPTLVVDPGKTGPPQDKPKNGYIGKSGTDITPTMRVELEVIRGAIPSTGQADRLRLGSQEVLPSRTIHVVNLWATWCDPCRDEMPDFKAMFARHPDWGQSVRFVPIQVKDPTDPLQAYREMDPVMPYAPVKLADRNLGDPFTSVLAADEELKLFRDNLPVTLVLDCNRRVRWAQFEQLSSIDFKELEVYVEKLREELSDTSPGAWCTREWPGNGRCEEGENLPGSHSLEDCGELRKKFGEPDVPPAAEAIPPVDCPEGMLRTSDGKCKRKLRGTPTSSAPEQPAEPEECDCPEGYVCKAGNDGRNICVKKTLK